MLLIFSSAAGRRIQLNQPRVFYRFKLYFTIVTILTGQD